LGITPDYAQALATLPANHCTAFEVPAGARHNGARYSLATIGGVRARDVYTGEIIDFGGIAFAQTPRGHPAPATWALLAGGGLAFAAAHHAQRTKWRACPTDSGVTSTTPSGLT